MKNKFRTTLVSAALLLFAACAGTSHTTSSNTSTGQAAVNTKCPVTGEEVDPTCCTTFQGSKVAFCCNKSIGKFNAMSDTEKKTKLQGAK